MNKTCNHCGKSKLIVQFGRLNVSPDGHNPRCLECSREYHKKLYDRSDKRRANIRTASLKWISSIKAKIDQIKDVPCMDCGKTYPSWVMDFDHAVGDKEFDISRASRSTRWETLKVEIEKCDVVCSNCHRQRTHNRLSGADRKPSL